MVSFLFFSFGMLSAQFTGNGSLVRSGLIAQLAASRAAWLAAPGAGRLAAKGLPEGNLRTLRSKLHSEVCL